MALAVDPKVCASKQLAHQLWGHGDRFDLRKPIPFLAITQCDMPDAVVEAKARVARMRPRGSGAATGGISQRCTAVIRPRGGARAFAMAFSSEGAPVVRIVLENGAWARESDVDMPSVPPLGPVKEAAFKVDQSSLDLVHGTMLAGWWVEETSSFFALDIVAVFGISVESMGEADENSVMFERRRDAVGVVCEWMSRLLGDEVRVLPAPAETMGTFGDSSASTSSAEFERLVASSEGCGMDAVVWVRNDSLPCSVSQDRYRAVEMPVRRRVSLMFFGGSWCAGSFERPKALDAREWSVLDEPDKSFVQDGVYEAEITLRKDRSGVLLCIGDRVHKKGLSTMASLREAQLWRVKMATLASLDRWVRAACAFAQNKDP